jgi:type IV pilus assembly protein PilY1
MLNRPGRFHRSLCHLLVATIALEPALVHAAAPKVSIADMPVATGNAASVKPNFMFVLDDSTSMGSTIMPTAHTSEGFVMWENQKIGSYSPDCNKIYYNPNAEYRIPPKALATDVVPRPTVVTAAPLDGYDWNAVNPVNLMTPPPIGFLSTQPNQLFYFKWTNATNPPDCDAQLTSPLPTGWQRVSVDPNAGGLNNYEHFATWFSYYRTRMNVMKSAAGLAFGESADDNFRIGFLTINPADSAGAIRRNSSSGYGKYLPIADYDATQKREFLRTLYRQTVEAGKTTPLQEALSRVGRLYAGKNDGINLGMIAATSDDPVQYSCQRNYTLLSTDGYWNEATSGNARAVQETALTSVNTTGSYIGDLDAGTPCITGSSGNCPTAGPVAGTVGRPFNDEYRGTVRTWLQKMTERSTPYVTAHPTSQFKASVSAFGRTYVCDAPLLQPDSGCGSAANPIPIPTAGAFPNSAASLVSLTASGGGAAQTLGWVKVYRHDWYRNDLLVKPHGRDRWMTMYPSSDGVPDSSPYVWDDTYSHGPGAPAGCAPLQYRVMPPDSPEKTPYCRVEAVYEQDRVTTSEYKGERVNVDLTSVYGPSSKKDHSLADVAMYYYETDLRQPATSGFTGTNAAGAEVHKNSVLGEASAAQFSREDKAEHQHMVTFTLGLGVSGFLDYQSRSTELERLRLGQKQWPGDFNTDRKTINIRRLVSAATGLEGIAPAEMPVKFSAPAASSRDFDIPGDTADATRAAIDDLWHAAVNGRGEYLSAESAEQVIEGLEATFDKINARDGNGAAVSVSNLRPTATDNHVYSTMYRTSRWSGDLTRRTINVSVAPTSPAFGTISAPVASAADALANQPAASRSIFLHRGNALVPFKWASLTATEQADLKATKLAEFGSDSTPSTRSQADLVNYLRGDRSQERDMVTNPTGRFRKRDSALGDIVNSKSVYLQAPQFSYSEHRYADFRAERQPAGAKYNQRRGTVYVGANDGMLHAFDALTLQERWAVVPPQVVPQLHQLATRLYGRKHQFFVDGTPVISDVYDIAGTASDEKDNWRTILVGGFNKGGQGYYALDITDENNPKALWTFSNNNLPAGEKDLGFSFGNPLITKRASDGKWVVVVTSGYNSDSGRGKLYVLDALAGPNAPVASYDTAADAAGTQQVGLAKITNFVDHTLVDNKTKHVYGGDLLGNLWRFDITAASGTAPFKLATLRDSTGVAQPITAAPELAELDNPSRRLIIVPTGKYLDFTDVSSTAKQSVYAIADTLGSTSTIDPRSATAGLTQCILTETAATSTSPARRSSSCGVGTAAAGWFIDLPNNRERVTVAPQIQLGTLTFASNTPDTDPCEGDGANFLHSLDFATGGGVPTANGTASAAIALPGGLMTDYTLVSTSRSNVEAIGSFATTATPGNAKPLDTAIKLKDGRRITWRELAQ